MNISNIDPINAMTGYKQKTTIWMDFSIAEHFGEKAVKETYDNFINSFGDNIEYMTELALTVNHKIAVYFKTNKALASVYNDLWLKIDNYIFEHFDGNKQAIQYYLATTD